MLLFVACYVREYTVEKMRSEKLNNSIQANEFAIQKRFMISPNNSRNQAYRNKKYFYIDLLKNLLKHLRTICLM